MKIKDYVLPITERTCVMGILNVTPDSFSDGGIYRDPSKAAARARQLVSSGADIIDVGGESSRPGAEKVSETEELCRVIPVIRAVKDAVNVAISIDTYKSEVARQALMEGAVIVNDITALKYDSCMAETIAGFDAGVILMHMKGTPETMQESPFYGNLINEIYAYLEESVILAEKAGIDPSKIIIDPGVGFGKTVQHNISILRELKRFKKLKKPVLVGTSRKSFIGKLTSKGIDEREFGTAASCAAAIINGADIIRVHNVGAMKDVAIITDKLFR
ncbi:MAG: dihydropteroate synthase [Candidatus Omnitrophota bacterium]